MLDAYLAGDVPHRVFADWCEEQGIVFPRTVPTVHRATRIRRVVGIGMAEWIAGRLGVRLSLSSVRTGSTSGHGRVWRWISTAMTRDAHGMSVSGSRAQPRSASVSLCGSAERWMNQGR